MELRDFVSETLVQIVKGIEDANELLLPGKEKAEQPFLLHHSLGDRPQAPHVQFDIAVTTPTEGSGVARGKAQLLVVGAELGGSMSMSSENVSRVKFSVVVKRHQGWLRLSLRWILFVCGERSDPPSQPATAISGL